MCMGPVHFSELDLHDSPNAVTKIQGCAASGGCLQVDLIAAD